MRKLLGFVPLCLLALAITAHADIINNYAINFTTTGDFPASDAIAPQSGFFSYDLTTQTVLALQVQWDGFWFSGQSGFFLSFPIPPGDHHASDAIVNEILTQTYPSTPGYAWVGLISPATNFFDFDTLPQSAQVDLRTTGDPGTACLCSVRSSGTWSLTPIPTPEPSTAVLFVTGLLGLLAAIWRLQRT